MGVSKDLNLDVPGCGDKLLNEHDVITKRLEALPLGRLQLRLKLCLGHGDSHALATAAPNCLDHDGVANFAGLCFQALNALVLAVISSEKVVTKIYDNSLVILYKTT